MSRIDDKNELEQQVEQNKRSQEASTRIGIVGESDGDRRMDSSVNSDDTKDTESKEQFRSQVMDNNEDQSHKMHLAVMPHNAITTPLPEEEQGGFWSRTFKAIGDWFMGLW
nr:hypothetical protein [Rickettsiaceae bacterium]